MKFVKRRLTSEDAAVLNAEKLVLTPKLQASGPGKHQLLGELKFSVCTAELCENKKKR